MRAAQTSMQGRALQCMPTHAACHQLSCIQSAMQMPSLTVTYPGTCYLVCNPSCR
jgi:hypothetical protein